MVNWLLLVHCIVKTLMAFLSRFFCQFFFVSLCFASSFIFTLGPSLSLFGFSFIVILSSSIMLWVLIYGLNVKYCICGIVFFVKLIVFHDLTLFENNLWNVIWMSLLLFYISEEWMYSLIFIVPKDIFNFWICLSSFKQTMMPNWCQKWNPKLCAVVGHRHLLIFVLPIYVQNSHLS